MEGGFCVAGTIGICSAVPMFSGSGVLAGGPGARGSGRVGDQGAFVVEADFRGYPAGGDDVFRENRLWIGVVGGYPLADGGPGRIDGLESVDVDWGIGWWWGCLIGIWFRAPAVGTGAWVM